MNSFSSKVSRYLFTLLLSNCKFEINTVTHIDLYDNLTTLNLIIQYKLSLILDYPKSDSSSLEQARLYQKTQVVMIPSLREKNLQLTELKLYINIITRCLGIVIILFERKQDNKFNTLTKCSNLLQVGYLKITQQDYVIKSTLQEQPNVYSSSYLPTKTKYTDLQPPLQPKHLILIILTHPM